MKHPPKQLVICGKPRKITYNTKREDGECDLATGSIIVGTANKSELLEILIHEVCEFILHIQGHRYQRYDEGNDGLRFVMDHHQYENFITELSAVLDQLYRV